MFDYLQQFNKLPKDLRSKISEKGIMSKISELEKRYQVNLAALVMKVMVKQVPYKNMALYLAGENDLTEKKAEELSKKLKETVFKDVSDYLDSNKGENINNEKKEDNIDKLKKIDKKEDPQELINQISKKEDHNTKIDKATKNIIDKADVSLSSSYLHGRLNMVLRTYIKGVRDKISTRSTLSRSGQEGGLSLDDASIDKLLKLVDEYKKSQESKIEKPKPKISEEAEKRDKLESLNESYNLKDSLKLKDKEKGNEVNSKKNKAGDKEVEKNKDDLYKKLHIKREIAPPPPVVSKEKEQSKIYKKDDSKESTEVQPENKETEVKDNEKQQAEKDIEKKEDVDMKKSKEVQNENKQEFIKPEDKDSQKQAEEQKHIDSKKKSFAVNNVKREEASSDLKDSSQETRKSTSSHLSQAPVSSGKKSMQDIKVSQRIMGPIDELNFFNLKNFRRLSSDPQEAFAKIKEKIDLLSKESYEKGIKATQAWKKNPLNKLYHQISIESINQSKPISEVIKQRQEKNRDYLSNEELKALVSFNRSLMF
ncbi:MAG TPA: hypothetical protein VJ926_03095 [Patescibacteria group bacterium]|nr:hypothetical protein [Patescibacteria group bacterium]